MISQYAMEDIEALQAEGVNLTPEEIVHLNALGHKVEFGDGSWDLHRLRRTARLDNATLYEPTLAHELWLDEFAQVADMENPRSALAVTAFALSHADPDSLPSARSRVWTPFRVHYFAARFRRETPARIAAAVNWCAQGADCFRVQRPTPKTKRRPPTGLVDVGDIAFSIPVGVLLNGVAVGLPMTMGDAKRLTRSQYDALVDASLAMRGLAQDEKRIWDDEYHRVLDEIKERHKKA